MSAQPGEDRMTARAPKRFYYGWVIVAVVWFCFLLSISSTLYAFGLFTLPVSREFGLSRSQFNTGITIVHIADVLVSPLVGLMVDRFSIRRVMGAGAILLGMALVTLGLSTSLTLDVLILALIVPFAFVSTTSITSYGLIARWFRAGRGRAMAIAAIGQSASGIIGVPIISYLIDALGWRQALIVTGSAVGITLSLLILLLIDHPRPEDVEPVSKARTGPVTIAIAEERSWTIGALLRSIRFWQFSVGCALTLGAITSIMLSLVPYGQALGMSTVRASTLISALATSAILTKFVLAIVADRVDRPLLFAISAIALAAMCAVLMMRPDYPMLMVGCLIGGTAMGTSYPLFAAIMADIFGTRSYGKVLGLAGPVMAGSNAAAAKFVGAVHDRTGTYDFAFATFIVTSLLAAVLLVLPLGSRPGASRVPKPVRVEPGPAVDPL
jgi:sugar phosphate permease